MVDVVSIHDWYSSTRRNVHTSRIDWWAKTVVWQFGRRPSVVGLGGHKSCLQQDSKDGLSLHLVDPMGEWSRNYVNFGSNHADEGFYISNHPRVLGLAARGPR